MKKQLFSALCLLMLCMGMKAQVAAYSFSQSNGTYVPLSATGATTLHATGWDNGVVGATIPFTFNFAGSAYTTCTVSTNGFISFGVSPGGSNYVPISSTTAYNGAISAFSRDLIDGPTGAQNPIICNTIGTAPTRTFVVQWTNARRYSGGSLTGDAYNFQICLNEAGGVAASQSVTIMYGACTATNTTSGVTLQVGLRGASNTDFHNRNTATDWSNTTLGTVNTASCLTTPTINPVSGLTFVYMPPAACVAPTAQATGLTFGGITSSVINGTYTAVATGTTSYLVIRTLGTAPNTPTNGVTYTTGASTPLAGTVVAVGTSSTFATTGLAGNTNYTYYVYAYSAVNCSGGPLYNTTAPLTGTVTTCPATPGTPTVSAITQTAFDLAWGSSVGGGAATVTYTVDVATNNTFATPVAGSPFVVTAPSSSVNISGLTTGNQYFYRIKADNGCSSAYTSTTSVTTLSAPCVAPSAQATGLTYGGITSTAVNGTYTPTSASGYLVIRTLGTAPNTPTNGVTYTTGTSVPLAGTVVAVGTASTFATTGLTGNTQYTYYIYAYNNTGCSGGPTYNVTTPLTGTVNTCPAKPTAVTNTLVTSNSFNLSWTASAGGTTLPLTYSVEVATDAAFTTPIAGSPFSLPASTTSLSLTGLNAATVYYYRVTADNGCNIGATTSANVTTSAIATDLQTTQLTAPAVNAIGCYASSIPVVIQIKNAGTTALDFSTNNATLITAITGVNPQTFTTVISTGTLAANATQTVLVTGTYNMSAAGVYTITATATLATPDANPSNDAMTVTRTNVGPSPLPQLATFAGYTGSATSLSASFPGWNEGSGTVTPAITSEGTFTVTNSTAHTGLYGSAAKMNLYNTNNGWLISPKVVPTASHFFRYKAALVTYNATTATNFGTNDTVRAMISTNCGVTWTPLRTFNTTTNQGLNGSTNALTQYSESLAAYAGQEVMVAIYARRGVSSTAPDIDIVIDDMEIASCFAPSAVTVTNTTISSADLSWTAPTSGTPNYVYEVRTSGAAGSGATGLASTGTVTAPSTSVTATGLSAVTAYSVYVRSDCGGGDLSVWTPVKTFTTPAACPAPTTPTVTNILGQSAVATWTVGGAETEWDVYYGPTPLTAPTATTVPTATVGTTPSYTITSLTPTTGYAVYVRANCGVGNISSWSAVRNFTTTVSCPAPSTLVISATTPTSAVATWTASGAETSWFVKYSSPTTTVVVSGTPSYTMAGLTPSTSYSIQVKGICGAADSSAYTTLKTFMTPCLPPNITGTTPGTRCGIGTTTLGATGDVGATLNWYTASTGGSAIGTGSVFTTPTITNTTTYYVEAVGGASSEMVGRPSTTVTSGYLDVNTGLVFNATSSFLIQSAIIYPVGTGSVTIAIQNNAGTEIAATNAIAVSGTGSTPVTVPINLNVMPGTGYRLVLKAYSGITDLVREGSIGGFPYNSPSGAMSITNGYFLGTATSYYYFYNIMIGTGCASARTPVAANVTAPPALALTNTTTVCANAISTVSVTSTASNYDSYVWSPVTNLYTDAAATIPYAGTSATTVYYKSATAGSTTYNVNASNSVSGCASLASTILNTSIPVINASVSPTVVCSGAAVTLSATTNANTTGNKTVGTNSSADYTGGPYREGAGSDNKAQWLFTAAELTAAGIAPGNITGLAFNVTTIGSGTMNNFTIRMGATTSTSLGATYDPAPATVVYGPVAYTAVSGANIHTFSAPFNWDGVSNVMIQLCHDAVSGGSSTSVSRQSISNRTSYTNGTAACTGTTGTTVAYRPVMTFTGQVVGQAAGNYTWQWNPGALNGNTVTANPVNTGTNVTTVSYTVSGTDPLTSCTNTAVVTVTVNPVPVAPVANNSTQCGFGVPTASVTGAGGTYKWYAASTGTTVLQSSASATYTTAIATSTTFYVSESNGTCESSRTAVTVTVTTPDALTASISTSTMCPGSSATLSVTQTGSTNTYTYSWTASPVAGSGIPTSVSGSTAMITPTASGLFTYTVTGTDGGCNAISTITLNVIAPPATPTVSPATPSVCAGSTATLTALGASATSSLITENFEGGTLGSFSVVNLANHTSGTVTQWAVRTSPYNGWTGATAINSGSSKFASTNNDAGSSGQKSNSCLVSGVVNTNGLTALNLNFRHFFDYFNYQAPDSCYLEVTTNGTNWTTVKTYTADVATSTSFGAESVALNAYVNQPTFQVRFRFRSGWNYGWCLDDIALLGTQTLPAVTYSWSPGTGLSATTGTMVTANPTSTTVYTITADNGSCTSSSAFTLTVNPVPTVTVAASTGSLCSGTTATLTAGGTATYSWMPAGGSASVAVVSPTTSTIYTVTGTSLGCSATQTVSLNVTPTPTVVASATPTVICAGATVSLTASGATTYSWMPNSSGSGTTTATPTVSTTYTVSGTTAGCTNTRTLNVTVNDVPTLTVTSNPSALCTTGATATLTATGTSTAYAWSNGANTASTTVAPTVTTVYTVTGTNSCGVKTMTTSIAVATTPTIAASSSSTLTCANNPAVLTASATPGVTFSWNTGPSTASITVTPNQTTTYTVTATNACGSAVATVVQNVSPCTGIEEVTNADGISIYPNPASDYVSIAIPANLVSAGTIVEITDALGKVVMKEAITTDVTTLRVAQLEDGVYFFKVITNSQAVKVGKVVKH